MKTFIYISLVAVFLLAASWVCRNQMRKTATFSRLWFVYTEVNKLSESRLTNVVGAISSDWKQISPSEYQALLASEEKTDEKLFLDLWGRSYLLAVRKNGILVEYSLRCLCPDGKPNTKDDYFIEGGKYFGPGVKNEIVLNIDTNAVLQLPPPQSRAGTLPAK